MNDPDAALAEPAPIPPPGRGVGSDDPVADPDGEDRPDDAWTGADGGDGPDGDGPERARRARSRRDRDRWVVLALVGLAAVAGALAPGRPTGHLVVDLVLRVAFAAGLTLATSRARRWTWLPLAGAPAAIIVLAVPANPVGLVSAFAALALALYAVFRKTRARWLGAAVGALAATALLRMGGTGPQGLTAVIAIAVVVPVLLSAYHRQPRRIRRRLLRAGLVVVGLVVLAAAGLAYAGLTSVSHVDAGVREARAGLDAARAADQAGTNSHLAAATTEFGAANAKLSAWYTVPARAVPVLSYQADALASMSGLGRDLSDLALTTSQSADYHGINLNDGRIDIDRLRTLEGPLVTVNTGLHEAADRTDAIDAEWLPGPLRSRLDDLSRQVHDAAGETDTAVMGVRVAPGLLGGDGVRNYFIAFTTPAESRGLGGYMGNWAVLTADHGSLTLSRRGRVADLTPAAGDPARVLDAPADYLARYGNNHPELLPGDATLSPDFPSVAQALASIYAQTPGGAPVDGALALDPTALAGMLQVTGPIKVAGLAEPLTADNAVDYLLRRQYLDFDQKRDRVDALDQISHDTFDAFIHTKGLKPSTLAAALGPSAAEQRILGYSAKPEEEAFIRRIRLDGAFTRPSGADFFSLVTQNAGNNKIDVYLHRTIDYRTTYDPASGKVDVNVAVQLRNEAPASGLPDYVIANRPDSNQPPGTNWMWFNFYSPHQLITSFVDDAPFAVGRQDEFGMYVYQGFLAVPAGGTVDVALHLTGTIDPGDAYRLAWHQQPMVSADRVSVFLNPSPGWAVVPSTPGGTGPALPPTPVGTGGTATPVVSGPSRSSTAIRIPLEPAR